MATKVYVTNPQASVGNLPDEWLLCYTALECITGLPAIPHPPCNEDTAVSIAFGDTGVVIRSKIVANVVARFVGVSSNDVIFVPEIGP
jgi:hypothetical protein